MGQNILWEKMVRELNLFHMRNLLLFLFVFFQIGCDPSDDRLKIINNTEEEVFYTISKVDSLLKNPLFIISNDTIWESSNIVLPNSYFKHSLIGNNEWEYFINRDCKDSTLRVFFFTKNLITNYNWDSLVQFQIYSEKQEMTVSDLKKKNWEIIYNKRD